MQKTEPPVLGRFPKLTEEEKRVAKQKSNRAYDRRFEREMAKMTVDDFLKWNPHFTRDQAAERIALAKTNAQAMKNDPLRDEIEDRLSNGACQVSIRQLEQVVKSLGYRFDRRLDCRSVARWMTGNRAGCSYPSCQLSLVQIDDGKSAFHVEARRDEQFKALQALRWNQPYFAVSKKAIVEF